MLYWLYKYMYAFLPTVVLVLGAGSLKNESRHGTNFAVIGRIVGCQNENLQRHYTLKTMLGLWKRWVW